MEAGSSKAGHASPPLQHQQIYAEIDKFYPGAGAGDQQIYCTRQDPAAGPSWTPGNQQLYHGHQLYSSSGSASSDQNTSSTDYSLAPLRSVQGLFCTKYELFVIVNEHKTLNISKIHTLNMFQQKAGMFP